MPSDVKIGEKIAVEGFDTTGEIPQLNPKKKVWDKIQSDLKTNAAGDALWKEFNLLTINGDKISSSLVSANIK